MEFGISFGALYADPLTVVQYSREGEALGYSYLFYPDSQTLYRDPFVIMGAVSQTTKKAKLGTLISPVATRDPSVLACAAYSVHELSGGRVVLVLGTGDSSVRRIGMKPADPDHFEKTVQYVKDLMAGRMFNFSSGEFCIRFARGGVPVYTIATGPRMLKRSGRMGDGAVIMVGPALTSWAVGEVRKGAEEAGLRFEDRELFWCGFCMIHEDRATAVARVKPSVSWYAVNFPKLVDMTGVNLPAGFWERVKTFRENYSRYDLVHSDAWEQAVREASFIPDELAVKMSLAGNVEDVVKTLRDVERLGVSKVVIRPPSHEDWYSVFKLFAEHVIPCFK
ncbi:MAG: LLM class flavin-dependent oxidoreductase [Candidatus Caldarchaeum sp.]